MQIDTHRIIIKADEVHTLGTAMELYLEDSMKHYGSYKTFEDIEEDEIRMLDVLCDLGNPLYTYTEKKAKAGKFSLGNSKRHTDAYSWAKARYPQVRKKFLEEQEAKNKKKK